MDQVYHGYDADQLAVQLDVAATVDNHAEIQQRNGADTAQARKAIPCTLDVAYGAAPEQKLDIYHPETKAGASYPILMDIHGGGWRAGSKNGRGFPATTFVPKGCVWAPIDYGLAPNYTVDQIVDHVRTAFAWLHKNAAQYGGDPSRMYIVGNSAGGHLTGTFLMPGWPGKYGLPDDVLKGVCAISGVFDLDALVHAPRGYNDELKMSLATARAHSPLYHLPKQSCPVIISYGALETDEFKRQSRDFVKAWTAAGLKSQEIEVKDANHFSIARNFADPQDSLCKAAIEMIGL